MPPDPVVPAVVERAVRAPGKCAVTHDIDGPFLDCGIAYENRGYWHRLYLHLPWVEEMGRKHCGMVPRSEYEALEQRLEDAEQDAEALQVAFDALTKEKQPV